MIIKLFYSGHAVKRMAERSIKPEAIREILEKGLVIAEYTDDNPLPSRLMLGWTGIRPIHIVVASDLNSGIEYVITVYEPDPSKWDETFTKRRK